MSWTFPQTLLVQYPLSQTRSALKSDTYELMSVLRMFLVLELFQFHIPELLMFNMYCIVSVTGNPGCQMLGSVHPMVSFQLYGNFSSHSKHNFGLGLWFKDAVSIIFKKHLLNTKWYMRKESWNRLWVRHELSWLLPLEWTSEATASTTLDVHSVFYHVVK